MEQKTFIVVASVLFFLVALLHLARIVSEWDVTIDGVAVPLSVSLAGLIIASSLAYCGLRLSGFASSSHKKKRR